jgi:hypothetical protein
VQNYTSIQLTKHFVRVGGRLRTDGDTTVISPVQNGSLTYEYLLDPCAAGSGHYRAEHLRPNRRLRPAPR